MSIAREYHAWTLDRTGWALGDPAPAVFVCHGCLAELRQRLAAALLRLIGCKAEVWFVAQPSITAVHHAADGTIAIGSINTRACVRLEGDP